MCSSNEVYAKAAGTTAEDLAKLGMYIYLAGRPGELEDTLKAASVQSFIYAGCDMLAVLKAAHKLLEIHQFAAT